MRISGRVQGVGFRWHAREVALGLGLVGRVRNHPDGSVKLVAEGRREDLEALLDWLERGPARARVDGCEVAWSTAAGNWSDFSITG